MATLNSGYRADADAALSHKQSSVPLGAGGRQKCSRLGNCICPDCHGQVLPADKITRLSEFEKDDRIASDELNGAEGGFIPVRVFFIYSPLCCIVV